MAINTHHGSPHNPLTAVGATPPGQSASTPETSISKRNSSKRSKPTIDVLSPLKHLVKTKIGSSASKKSERPQRLTQFSVTESYGSLHYASSVKEPNESDDEDYVDALTGPDLKSCLAKSDMIARLDLHEFRKTGGKIAQPHPVAMTAYSTKADGTLDAKPDAILADMMRTNQFVHIGEFHHSKSITDFLGANVKAMADAGVKYFFSEVIPQHSAADIQNFKIPHQKGQRIYYLVERPGHASETLSKNKHLAAFHQ